MGVRVRGVRWTMLAVIAVGECGTPRCRDAVRELTPGHTELPVPPGAAVSEEVTKPRLSAGSASRADGFRGYPENREEVRARGDPGAAELCSLRDREHRGAVLRGGFKISITDRRVRDEFFQE